MDVQGVAPVGDLAVSKEGADDVDVFAESGDGEVVGDAVLALDLDLMTGPEPQDETAIGEVVEAGGGHGDGWGATYVDADDGCAELYVLCGEGAGGKGGELVTAVALGEPEGVVAEGVGELAALDDFGGGHVLAAEADAEFLSHGGEIIREGRALPPTGG